MRQRALRDAHCPLEGACIADFACGRGGDLNKVNGCRRYWGVDVADLALRELQRRADEIHLANCTIVCRDAGTPGTVPEFPCDLALCNFALHYFCDTEEHCQALLVNVAACLRVGGTFAGIYLSNDACQAFGRAYHAKVGDCVDAVEYLVPFGRVVGMAYALGMHLARMDPGAPACHCGCATFVFVRVHLD